MHKYIFAPDKIRQARVDKGVSLTTIKEKLGVANKSQIEQWERGDRTPGADKIAMLASVIDVPPCAFYIIDSECECGSK